MSTEHREGAEAPRPPEIRRHEAGGHGVFFVERDGERLARLVYARASGLATLVHTEVSERLAGQGVGRALVEAAVAWARAEQLKLEPQCPFARSVFEKTPALRDVLGGADLAP